MEECWRSFNRIVHVVFEGSEEQKRTDACALARHVRNLGKLEVSACPLFGQGRKEGGCSAKHKAQQPYAIYADDGDAGRE